MIVRPGTPYGKGGLAVFFAKDANSWISFPVRVEKSGRWRIGGYSARASDLGRYLLSVDGRALGPAIDFFNSTGGWGPTHVVPTGEIVFGEVELEQGENLLRFECLGKREGSSAHFLAVDSLTPRQTDGPWPSPDREPISDPSGSRAIHARSAQMTSEIER